MTELELYYNKFNEEKRLNSRHGQVEYRISMKYIEEMLLGLQNTVEGSREKEESVKKTEELFDYFELTDAKDKYPSELSGGMAKRISIIRALVHGGNILLCDEPYNGLDLRMCLKAEELFINYAKESCVILVSHDKERTAAASESLDLSHCGHDF